MIWILGDGYNDNVVYIDLELSNLTVKICWIKSVLLGNLKTILRLFSPCLNHFRRFMVIAMFGSQMVKSCFHGSAILEKIDKLALKKDTFHYKKELIV